MRLFLIAAFICFTLPLFSQVSLSLETYASGFSQPVDIVHAGDSRLFVVEKGGLIRILDADGNTLPTPFLDIDARVNSIASERGLLGLAFHPDYENTGYFYVNYTNNSGDTRISRFSVTNDPNIADPDSEQILMELDQPFSNHNGGCLRFGPDGYLYIGTGDGGSANDPENSGQDRLSLLGKMLRIDVDNGNPYSIPEDNPFAFDDFTLDEVWALGLRNPWRFSFDSETGDLWIGDVGQNQWEEIDFQPADSEGGENYGWRCYEGFEPYLTNGCPNPSELTPPVQVYANNNNVGCSVTGGQVYRGEQYPEASGWYIYADFCSGRIWALYPDKAGDWVNLELLNASNNNIVGFGEDIDQELYMVGIGTGEIYKLAFECTPPSAPEVSGDATICGGGSNSLLFAGNAPAGYSFCWFFNGEIIEGESEAALEIFDAGEYSVQLVAGESSCVSEVSDPLNVTFVPMPEVLVFTVGDELQATEGFVSYQWELDGEPITGATDPNYTVDEPGNYWVIVTDEFGCQWQSITVTITNSKEALKIERLSVSPNPFQEELQLSFKVTTAGEYQLRLYNAQGQKSWEKQIEVAKNWSGNIPVVDLPKGSYYLEISIDGQQLTLPLIKQ